MKMWLKKGVTAIVNKFIYGFVGIVVIFALLASLYPTMVSYGATYCSSGAPLAGFFGTSGAVGWLIFGAVIVIGLIALIMTSFKTGGK